MRDGDPARTVVALGTGLGAVFSVAPSVTPAAALATGAGVALVLRRLTEASRFGVATGVVLFAIAGVATLADGVPPAYGDGVGVAILAALAAGLLGLELVVRIDGRDERRLDESLLVRLHADLQVHGWVRFLVWYATALLVVVHGIVVYVDAGSTLAAATLVPVALAVFAAFPVTARRRHFHAAPEESPLAVVADRVGSIPGALGSVRDAIWPGPGAGIGRRLRRIVTETSSRPGRRTGRSSTTGSGARRRGRTRSETAGADADDGEVGTEADDASDPGRDDGPDADRDDASLPACQNCGSEGEDRERRPVTDDYRAVLCRECRGARIARREGIDDCRGRVYPVDREAVLGAHDGACVGCGADCRALELHAIVPVDGAGHSHPHNVVPLCPVCHEDAH